ncbi:uncharacterized protein LAJ45_11196 [Morchella importuna]|uniref:uncharacterized protein n=1 Tax=Morchella importuna TaxID=1174673 RepID=UPI001E8CCF77|nr:uncharacterized protein LAJ45_11215 [Morchella importuna]XP_045966104.1 uncharacterized protein LAJ45_11196 [Morchella importuna]KAH8144780.1 hypothetical protein LAJ45_11215 [Morchella importuna]KAH8144800.1 hypothetical protein LAJ45_11196 [Morchella importuna]
MSQKPPVSRRSKGLSEKIASDRYYGFNKELPIQELINALSSESESWTLDEIDEKKIEQLLADIKTPTSIPEVRSRKEASVEVVPTWLQSNISEEGIKSDTNAEEDILKMIKDEIEFERAHGISMNDFDEERSQTRDRERPPTPKKTELDEDLLKRFEALGGLELPPAPRMDPRTKQRFDVDPVLVESDTWCCICNEDGEYRCSGCENDIYCASCLYEAHTGPNAGYEERKHKWTKYTKPKKLAPC